jgi:hypothetical protein
LSMAPMQAEAQGLGGGAAAPPPGGGGWEARGAGGATPACGPCGVSVEAQLARNDRANASFSQYAWESMKQEGCRPCGGVGGKGALPTWPPKGAWIVPQYAREAEEVIGMGDGGADALFEGQAFAEGPSGPCAAAEALGGQGGGPAYSSDIVDDAERFARIASDALARQEALGAAAATAALPPVQKKHAHPPPRYHPGEPAARRDDAEPAGAGAFAPPTAAPKGSINPFALSGVIVVSLLVGIGIAKVLQPHDTTKSVTRY